jgi:rhodanese-related sulfurtransferase
VGNTYTSEFNSEFVEKGAENDLPSLSTGLKTGQEILENRLAAVFAEGFGAAKVSTAEVVGAPESYYIVNYWSAADYTNIGHLNGATQYTPKTSMSITADLKTLPTDKKIAVYCWTGQTSANLAAYLRLIGYDAKSILFGVNGMIYNSLEANKWSEGAIMGYPYVTN